jgi:signal transduction histidine kinase
MTNELEQQLTSLKQGDHVCLIYKNITEQMAAAVPFIRQGLARGERCVYIAADHAVEEVVQALAAAGVDVGQERQRGALRLLTKADAYLRSGEFDSQAMIDFLRQVENEALADGFSGVRIAGEMTWVLGPKGGLNRLIEYEAMLNHFLMNSRSEILCQYNHSRFESPCVHDVLLTHPLAILGEQVCSNPYYEPPELVLDREPLATSAHTAKRVDWWIQQLRRARTAEREREQMLERMQALSRRLLEVPEAERRHLAGELHDEVGQMLTGLRLLLKPDRDLPTEALQGRFEQARGIIDELLERIRGLSFDLRPAALDQLGLLPALLALFERYTNQTGVLVQFKHKGLEERLAPEVETNAYRIVQEALTNVARHAGVAGVTVRIWAATDVLSIQIEDQGRGFDPEVALATTRSRGLAGIQERVMLLGGQVTIESKPRAGTQITAQLPLHGHFRKEE